jgi:hypothetical protein
MMKRMAFTLLLAAVSPAPLAAQIAGPASPVRTVSAQAAVPGAERPRPVQQQSGTGRGAPVNGVLVLYGNERCPTNSDGDEIVVCERRSAEEQFRVPKELRNFEITPQNQSWAARAQGVMDTGSGVNTIGSCSTVGIGGGTGCFVQQARAARAERKARAAEERAIP